MQNIILATNSKYKQQLFQRLNLKFEAESADIDESPHRGEDAPTLAKRLAHQKAVKLAKLKKGCWIIGADQCAQNRDTLVSKPLSHAHAVEDLQAYSGNRVEFYTSVCLISPDGQSEQFTDKTVVEFRILNLLEIENYLRIEQPYDCAGSFKAEGLGISLFHAIKTEDPTAIIGLPLIQLSQTLRDQGFDCYSRNTYSTNIGSKSSES